MYVSASAPETWQQRLWGAILAGSQGTVASHLSAAALFQLIPPPPVLHVTLPPTASARKRAGIPHRSPLPRPDRCKVGNIPCTTPARTLVDCAALVSLDALCDLVDTALYRGLTTVGKVRAAIQRAGRNRKGTRQLEEALVVWDDVIRPGSPAEARVLRWLSRNGFPVPERQYAIENEDGEVVAKGDFVWPDPMVLMEYDGEEFHGPRRWKLDDEREGKVVALLWKVVRADKFDFRPSATRLLDLLRETLPGL